MSGDLRYTPLMATPLKDQQRAIALKVLAGFEAAERKQRELARREGPRLEWAVEVSTEMFEVAWPKLQGRAHRESREREAEPVRRLYREAVGRADSSGRSPMSLAFSRSSSVPLLSSAA